MAQVAASSTVQQRRRHANLALAAVASAAAALAWMLRRFPPAQNSFYPRCPIYEWTGLLCPGCGGTRALAALANGNLTEALHWNALVVILLPVLLAWAAVAYWRAATGRSLAWPKIPNLAVAALLAVTAMFELIRN